MPFCYNIKDTVHSFYVRDNLKILLVRVRCQCNSVKAVLLYIRT